MRAARFVEINRSPEQCDLPTPHPRGAHEVVVRVAGAGVCRTDLHILSGASPLQPAPRPPFTLGHETAGWVEEIGSDVSGFARGDPVILHPTITCGLCLGCRDGRDMYCTAQRFPGVDGSDGGYAEFVLTSDRALVPVAPTSNLIELAPLADAGLTAYHAVKRLVPRLTPGSTVVILGVGGLGHLGLQLVKELTPSEIIAVDLSDERLEMARGLGAEHVVSATDPRLVAEVLRLTGSRGAEAVLDFVAEGDTPTLSVQMLGRGGIYSIVGYGGVLSTPTVEMIVKELTVMGNFVGSYRDLVELMELSRRGRVKILTRRYPLAEAGKAVEDLRNGGILGRAVLVA